MWQCKSKYLKDLETCERGTSTSEWSFLPVFKKEQSTTEIQDREVVLCFLEGKNLEALIKLNL